MFTAEDIRRRVKKQPFIPVRLITSAGDRYDIYHPDLVVIGSRDLTVGTASADNPTFSEQTSWLPVMHIAAVEDLAPPGAMPKNGQ